MKKLQILTLLTASSAANMIQPGATYNCPNSTFFSKFKTPDFTIDIFGLTESEHDYNYVYIFNEFEREYKSSNLYQYMPELKLELYFRNQEFKSSDSANDHSTVRIKMSDEYLNKPKLLNKYIKAKVQEIKKEIDIKCGI